MLYLICKLVEKVFVCFWCQSMKIKRKTLRFLDLTSKTFGEKKNLSDIFESTYKNKNGKTILYSRGKKIQAFFTEDSKLYITPREAKLLRKGVKLNRSIRDWDNLSSRVVSDFVRYQPNQSSVLLEMLEKRYELLKENAAQASQDLLGQFSLIRLWNLSIVGSILFGMVTMTFVYRYLGQGADAATTQVAAQVAAGQQAVQLPSQVETFSLATNFGKDAILEESFSKQIEEIQRASDQAALEKEIYGMVKGHPIEKMVPYIAKQDRTVAAFIVAIAKKESGWGQHHPVLNGQDCNNYWGYRGIREKMGTGGHTCFDNPEDAVNTVAKRIKTLAQENGRDTAAKMVIWKCGNDCEATGGQAAANKWISDVDSIFEQLNS